MRGVGGSGDGLRHAMGREDHRPVALRNLIELVDEDRALGLEIVDHEFVVHDFVAHIDRRAIERQRPLDDVDGPHHPGAEPAGRGEEYLEGPLAHGG